MREIKLRFWDKENKSMVYQDNKCLYPFNIYKIICDLFTNFEFRLFILKDNNLNQFEEVDSIKMQYTGLKDSNGKEIYEGDILSYKKIIYTNCSEEEIERIEDEALIGLITYRPLASIIKPYSKNVRMFGYDSENHEGILLSLQSEELEVIGNIYENPELI